MKRSPAGVAFVAALLTACASVGGQRAREATFDFGLPAPAAVTPVSIRGSVLVPEVLAPEWLDSAGINYRLAYDDDARARIYAAHRWAASPALLITQRLRAAVADATGGRLLLPQDSAQADWILRVELESFSQVFDAPERSRALATMRATLIRASARQVVAQRTFIAEGIAPSADAAGGAKALGRAANEAVEAIVVWTAERAR
jgi:cholesterol transport system auxiliary component